MAKNKITQWSATSASNTDVGGIQIEGENVVANFDNALREIMKQIADFNTGVSFIHDTYKIADSDDETKLAEFDAGSITAGQTRTFTFPDKDGTLAIAADVLALSGGTLTGFLTLHAAPTADLHPASKKYVDDKAASPVFTGDAEFANISDGTTTVDASYPVEGSARAWCRFDGSGTVAIDHSFGVSSLTDRGTGLYTGNLSSAMVDAQHNATMTCDTWHAIQDNSADTTTSIGMRCAGSSHTNQDAGDAAFLLHGDLE